MRRGQHDLFPSLSPKLYQCSQCKLFLTAWEYDQHGGIPSRDYLQRTCKECRSGGENKVENYCDLCNKYGIINYSWEEDGLLFYFCCKLCFSRWTEPYKHYAD